MLEGRADRVHSLFQMLLRGAIRCASLGVERETFLWLEKFYERFGEHAPDLADAALMYLAERDRANKVFTLDFQDFAIYRTSDNRALEIVGQVAK